MNYTIYEHGINIKDSYEVKGVDNIALAIQEILNDNFPKISNVNGWHRTLRNYTAEWLFHNFCYKLHFMRSHAKDVFLDKELKGFRGSLEKCIYKVIELFI